MTCSLLRRLCASAFVRLLSFCSPVHSLARGSLWNQVALVPTANIVRMNGTVLIGMLVCLLVVSSSALQCMTGVDGSSVRKVDYSPLFKCCYRYTAVNNKKIGNYGVVPINLSKQACAQAGKCFYYKEHNINVCVCANADDPNCQPKTSISKSPK